MEGAFLAGRTWVLFLTLLGWVGAFKVPPLGGYTVKKHSITVSGFSSGGNMAVQLGVAHSETFTGVGVFSGGPYACGMGQLSVALTSCSAGNPLPLSSTLLSLARAYSKQGLIDDIEFVGSQVIYLYSGTKDKRVTPEVTDVLASFYSALLPVDTNLLLQYKKLSGASHTFPTSNEQGQAKTCNINDGVPPFLSDCWYDGAGEMFQHLYDYLKDAYPPKLGEGWNSQKTLDSTFKGQFVEFNQKEFGDVEALSMDDTGFLYVPEQCRSTQIACKLHVALHGCQQSFSSDGVGMNFMERGGFWQWADVNNILVLFPQAKASFVSPYNPLACWDYWGYSDPPVAVDPLLILQQPLLYLTRQGGQIVAIKKMVDRIANLTANVALPTPFPMPTPLPVPPTAPAASLAGDGLDWASILDRFGALTLNQRITHLTWVLLALIQLVLGCVQLLNEYSPLPAIKEAGIETRNSFKAIAIPAFTAGGGIEPATIDTSLSEKNAKVHNFMRASLKQKEKQKENDGGRGYVPPLEGDGGIVSSPTAHNDGSASTVKKVRSKTIEVVFSGKARRQCVWFVLCGEEKTGPVVTTLFQYYAHRLVCLVSILQLARMADPIGFLRIYNLSVVMVFNYLLDGLLRILFVWYIICLNSNLYSQVVNRTKDTAVQQNTARIILRTRSFLLLMQFTFILTTIISSLLFVFTEGRQWTEAMHQGFVAFSSVLLFVLFNYTLYHIKLLIQYQVMALSAVDSLPAMSSIFTERQTNSSRLKRVQKAMFWQQFFVSLFFVASISLHVFYCLQRMDRFKFQPLYDKALSSASQLLVLELAMVVWMQVAAVGLVLWHTWLAPRCCPMVEYGGNNEPVYIAYDDDVDQHGGIPDPQSVGNKYAKNTSVVSKGTAIKLSVFSNQSKESQRRLLQRAASELDVQGEKKLAAGGDTASSLATVTVHSDFQYDARSQATSVASTTFTLGTATSAATSLTVDEDEDVFGELPTVPSAYFLQCVGGDQAGREASFNKGDCSFNVGTSQHGSRKVSYAYDPGTHGRQSAISIAEDVLMSDKEQLQQKRKSAKSKLAPKKTSLMSNQSDLSMIQESSSFIPGPHTGGARPSAVSRKQSEFRKKKEEVIFAAALRAPSIIAVAGSNKQLPVKQLSEPVKPQASLNDRTRNQKAISEADSMPSTSEFSLTNSELSSSQVNDNPLAVMQMMKEQGRTSQGSRDLEKEKREEALFSMNVESPVIHRPTFSLHPPPTKKYDLH